MVFKQAGPITSKRQVCNREAAVNQPFTLIEASSYSSHVFAHISHTAALQAATAYCRPEVNT